MPVQERALVVDAGVAAAAIDSLRAEFPKLAVIRACELGARAARQRLGQVGRLDIAVTRMADGSNQPFGVA